MYQRKPTEAELIAEKAAKKAADELAARKVAADKANMEQAAAAEKARAKEKV
jgi:hypothetical protein